MRRGSTPTHTFTLPPNTVGDITAVEVTYKQNGEIILQKREQDCTIKGKVIFVALSQEDTFLFDDDAMVKIQIRVKIDDKVFTSNVMRVSCRECLSSEVL